MSAISEHQRLLGLRSPQTGDSAPGAIDSKDPSASHPEERPARRGLAALLPSFDRAAREERTEEKERRREADSLEAAMQAFYETPAGKARLAYKRGHRLFQYELEIGELPPTLVPGPVGSPARQTTDPVDILNSVTVEGWKLVTGKFIHSEVRGTAVGVYLFKRSQKRRLAMNEPWRAPRA
ncbi:MAG TPA: hypothetical protein VG816_12545 [Solirubrobacterales bacterium]|nr:hypothetical protein [Solirubrobacterales bacterium]